MNISPAKENILKKIRQALTESTPLPFPQAEGNNSVFPASLQPLEFEFAEHFSSLLGKFIYCVNHAEVAAQLGIGDVHAALAREDVKARRRARDRRRQRKLRAA